MQIDLKKLEARIQKLQEIKRIAADPELVSLLLEFLGNDEERKAKEAPPAPAAQPKASTPFPDDMDLVDQVLKGTDPKPHVAWNAKRA